MPWLGIRLDILLRTLHLHGVQLPQVMHLPPGPAVLPQVMQLPPGPAIPQVMQPPSGPAVYTQQQPATLPQVMQLPLPPPLLPASLNMQQQLHPPLPLGPGPAVYTLQPAMLPQLMQLPDSAGRSCPGRASRY